MRVAFLGKGGSGKSTMAAAFTKHVGKTQSVVAIDADVNQHLGSLLNIENGKSMGDTFCSIQQYVLGARTDLAASEVVGTLPPSKHSRFITVNLDDPFIREHAVTKGNVSMLQVGTYEGKDVGKTCYHTKLASLELFMHHLLDRKNDMVIVDSTAGIDILGTSLHMAYDVLVFVVEPTQKSVAVYNDFMQRYTGDSRVVVIGNKVMDGDEAYLREQIGDSLVGIIPHSKSVRQYEQGRTPFDSFVDANSEVFDGILQKIGTVERDWGSYLHNLCTAHDQICKEWYDAYYKKELSKLSETEFSYNEVIQ